MSATKTQLETAATGITFEQLRVSYFTELNQHTRAEEARREVAKWQSKYETAWLNQGGEVQS